MVSTSQAYSTGALFEEDAQYVDTEKVAAEDIVPVQREAQIVWRNVIFFTILHLSALYGLYLCFTSAKLYTIFFAFILYKLGSLGITAGAHRLWAHRCYKATLPLRIFLMLCDTLAFQDAVVDWARDHRVHHKFTETDADPHNAKRGFFFSHVGWLLVRKHPDVRAKGKCIDLSDLQADPVLRFQKRHYNQLMPIVCFALPTILPWLLWGETISNSWFVCAQLRYCFGLNVTWLVNSAAHMWGDRPYDKYIYSAENIVVALLTLGEGWHNYHHTFPWDYKAAELGSYAVNETALFLDMCALLGLARELKSVDSEAVRRRALRTGDGSRWAHTDQDTAKNASSLDE